MELAAHKKAFLVENQSRLNERLFLIDAMTQVAGRPKLTTPGPLPSLKDPVLYYHCFELQEGRTFQKPSMTFDRTIVDPVLKWIDTNVYEMVYAYDSVADLLEHYQNFLAMSDEMQATSDEECKKLFNRTNTELFQYYLSPAYNALRFNKYVVREGDVFELYSTKDQRSCLVYCSGKDVDKYIYQLSYLQDDLNQRILGEIDTFQLKKGDINNFQEEVTTTVGRYLLNRLLLVGPFKERFPYKNEQFTKVLSSLEDDIAKGMLDGSISVDAYKEYINNLFFIGHFTELCVPTYSRKSLSTSPEVKKVKQELIKKYKDQLHDPGTINEIENTLIKMDKAYLQGDSSMRFYEPLGDKPFNISRKKMYLTVGGVEEFTKGAGAYEFIENSLAEGMTAKAIPAMANETRKGSFNRGDQTKLGGALTKLVIRVLQDLVAVEEDCHTVQGLQVDTSRFPISRYYWSYVWDKDGWTLLTEQNAHQFNKGIQLIRSPMHCLTKNGLCKRCLGEMYAKLDKKHLALEAVDVTSTFTTDALKSMHGTKISMFEVTDLQEYIIH